MNKLVMGAIAGAVGTIALDVVSYGDMALSGRPSSDVSAEVIRRTAEEAGIQTLATPSERADEQTKNRRTALGAILGHANGVVAGMVCGALGGLTGSLPWPVMALAMGAAVMAASDVPATTLHATNPSEWGVSGWVRDIIPHLAFGFAASGVFAALEK